MNESTITKKAYKITVVNILSIVAFCFALYFFIFPDSEGWAYLGGIVLILFAVVGITVDLILQSFIKNYWRLNLVEIVLLGIAYLVLSLN